MSFRELPIPNSFLDERVADVWRVPYQERAADAAYERFESAGLHGIR